jgi:Fe-S cluster biogenesis protein NfuA
MENQTTHTLEDKVKNIIDQIRPYLQADGGDIQFVAIKDNKIVEVELQGACHSCPMAIVTLKQGVEASIKKALPEIEEVVALNLRR